MKVVSEVARVAMARCRSMCGPHSHSCCVLHLNSFQVSFQKHLKSLGVFDVCYFGA